MLPKSNYTGEDPEGNSKSLALLRCSSTSAECALFALAAVRRAERQRSMQIKSLMSLDMLRVVGNLNTFSSHRCKILAKYPAPVLPQLSGGFDTSEPGTTSLYNLTKIPEKGYYL